MRRGRGLRLIAVALAAAIAVSAESRAALFKPWIDGTGQEPETQVQSIDTDTFVVRQSIRTNFEGPFLYLLFGADRALLLDTGAGGLQIRPAIDAVIAQWCKSHGRASIPLVVAHTHAHGDHHQGDAEFAARPDTVVVGLTQQDVAAFFHISAWPTQLVQFDLGGRVLDIIPTPGHEDSHIMVYDARTHILQGGDALYPGRLYFPAAQFGAFKESVDRVVAFTKTHSVSHILSNHIEMTHTHGRDFPMRAPSHPNERELELPYSALLELQAALAKMGTTPVRDVHDDFIIYPR